MIYTRHTYSVCGLFQSWKTKIKVTTCLNQIHYLGNPFTSHDPQLFFVFLDSSILVVDLGGRYRPLMVSTLLMKSIFINMMIEIIWFHPKTCNPTISFSFVNISIFEESMLSDLGGHDMHLAHLRHIFRAINFQ